MRYINFKLVSFLSNEILKMKLLFFISLLFSVSYACTTRANNPRYNILSKPYVLDLLNSKGIAKLKKTPCFQNLHYLITNPGVHKLAKLPIFRALLRSRIPAFREFLNNLKLGPSATKGKIYLNKISFEIESL